MPKRSATDRILQTFVPGAVIERRRFCSPVSTVLVQLLTTSDRAREEPRLQPERDGRIRMS
jgi:hypothetical protein